MKVTHYVLVPQRLNHEKGFTMNHLYGTITKDGRFTALSGQKFDASRAYPVSYR